MKTKKPIEMKKAIFKLPEYYLMTLAILAGYSPPFNVNPIFMGILSLLILQIIVKNKIFGVVLGILFFLTNLFFLGALLSEFYGFTEFNSSAKQLIFVGFFIWAINLLMSIIMIYKYSLNNFDNSLQVRLEKQNI